VKYLAAILMMVGGLLLLLSPLVSFDGLLSVDGEGAWVLIIEETADRSPVVARLLADQEYWKSLESRGLRWRPYDVDSPDAEAYRGKATEVGLPALLIVAKDGTPLLAKPAPATTQGVDADVRRYTGR
jgi:hypothetical protein